MPGRHCRRRWRGAAALDAAPVRLPQPVAARRSSPRGNAGRCDVVENLLGLEAAAAGAPDRKARARRAARRRRTATLSCCMTAIIARWAATAITSSPLSNTGCRAGATRASNLLQSNRRPNGSAAHAAASTTRMRSMRPALDPLSAGRREQGHHGRATVLY